MDMMNNISKKAFNMGFTTGNENVDHFIKATTSTKLSPDSDRNGDISKYLDLSSVKLANCEIPLFKINQDVNILLKNTNNKPYYRPLPFKMMFIDITDYCDSGNALKPHNSSGNIVETKGYGCKKLSCCGFLLFDTGKVITVTSPIRTLWTIDGKAEKNIYSFWDSNIGGEIFIRDKLSIIPEDVKKKYKEYICNILDFINHPDINFICSEKHNRNDLRIKRGLKPLFTKYNIILKGKLKKYISETLTNNKKAWDLGHRFWVRGHWVNFYSDRYKNVKGTKKWILPYIKGKGKLINKKYYIGEKEQEWENEKRMFEIIQSLLPKYKVEKHNRTIFNGLEIDCYIPELNIGFEYNGLQHYEWVKVFHKTKDEFENQKRRDIKKLELAKKKGIKLITIRYDEPLSKELILFKLKEVYNGESK